LAVAREASQTLRQLVKESAEFRQFVEDALISPAVKRETLTRLLGNQLHPFVMSFLMLLVENRRESDLEAIVEEALRQLDAQEGIERARVRSAVPLSDAQVDALSAALSRMRGRRVLLELEVDPTLKGGFVVLLADTVVDASVTTQLKRIRDKMIEG